MLCDGTCLTHVLCDGTCHTHVLCDGHVTRHTHVLCDCTCHTHVVCDGACLMRVAHACVVWRTGLVLLKIPKEGGTQGTSQVLHFDYWFLLQSTVLKYKA
jgi:hypothetical protein